MLIQALCDYYDELAKDGKVVPEGYSKRAVDYVITLTSDGSIYAISKCDSTKEMEFPLRTEKTCIDSNFIEHRPLYIFGLNYEKGIFTPNDEKDKAKKSHDAFVNKNLELLQGLNSPLINAYRNFILTWDPEKETENTNLSVPGNKYSSSAYVFELKFNEGYYLNNDPLVRERWNEYLNNLNTTKELTSQCAVTGERLPIARIHGKIKGVAGGLSSGTVLIGYKTSAGCSYCNEQSYNSNVSELAMKKYTFALNSLLADKKHKTVIDDVTVVYWATGGEKNERCSDLFDLVFNDDGSEDFDDKPDKGETEKMLQDTFKLAKSGELTKDRLSSLTETDDSIDFYIVGLKPNASRVAVKFIYRRKFADILFNIAKHQADLTIIGRDKRVPLWRLKNELISPKSTNQHVDSSLLSAIFKAIIYDSPYPVYLLSTLVTRAKTDQDDETKKFKSVNSVRAGAIKACINRKSRALNEKEELQVALDINNTNQAYLCGRLFAVLERIQKQALGDVNRSVKDAYFSSAASKPSLVFPKLISLSQNHMKKLDEGGNVYYNKLIEEIIDKLDGQFPDILSLTDQGKFMIGYYHQDKDFYTKKNKEDK